MPAPVLFGGGGRSSAAPSPLPRRRPVAPPTPHGIDAFSVILDGAISRLDFARALGGLAQERGNDLLRVKGIVRFADRPDRPAVVQAAQHAMFTPEWLDDWPDQDRRSRLVFIVHDIAPDEILARFAFAAPPFSDRAASSPHAGGLRHRIRRPHMLDIVISGGLAVLPSGPEPADIGVAGREDRRDRRAGQPRRARRRPGRSTPRARSSSRAASTRMSIATGRCRCRTAKPS